MGFEAERLGHRFQWKSVEAIKVDALTRRNRELYAQFIGDKQFIVAHCVLE